MSTGGGFCLQDFTVTPLKRLMKLEENQVENHASSLFIADHVDWII
ncbi:Unknown protein sequence [Pseudomonas syringae pv. syringae]|uniref:Uncharacterized protein n=1 Tax=Pseudomonas syringae pv. coryli TaxID=317659 RepID=A0A0P9N0H1_9PSED|nr:Unknown protein sequence [Pseudomonas syringae pv. aceris]KPB25201.1 Unknown protein sequence [Pseudomonas syringae pv. syringae]KPW98082.1 hypothetical protein ALO75_102039 [Pseudomonas syringae pv. coryli]RMR46283.1 hypothetical protein ALP85_101630 [Pseudomonas syringae pv. syringae]